MLALYLPALARRGIAKALKSAYYALVMKNLAESALRERICRVGATLYARGLIGGVSGNLSVRLPDGGYLATPTGSCLGTLTPGDISLLDADGRHCSGPAPTTEMPVHLAVYAARPACTAVAHAHSPYAVAWACLSGLDPANAVPAYTPYGLMRYGRVGLAAYAPPGSEALVAAVARVAPQCAALLLAHHGSMAAGTDVEDAAHSLEELESACHVALTLRGLPGQSACPLDDAAQEALLQYYAHNRQHCA